MPGDLRVDLRVTLLLTVFRRALLFSISIHNGCAEGSPDSWLHQLVGHPLYLQ
jgi:hypothetical protein